ncbi:MAG: MucBP domain-containing protein, partial [Liquorilactobacillus hordei]|uniref:lectin-like domain-containing protein n=1 Tax=Liquorilactobacillus hordei TaxID=468911 RepID=UPI0039E9C6ED
MKKGLHNKRILDLGYKNRVKLYKTGKGWVSALLGTLRFIRVSDVKEKLNESSQKVNDSTKNEDSTRSFGLSKAVAFIGAIAGGTVVSTGAALADQTDSTTKSVAKEVSDDTVLANQDSTVISSGSQTDSQNVSATQSTSSSTSTSVVQAASEAASQSTSTSEIASTTASESAGQSTAISEAASTSAANKSSEVTSTSSASTSGSTSTSVTSQSESTASTSESTVESTSDSSAGTTSQQSTASSESTSTAPTASESTTTNQVQVSYKTLVQAYATELGDSNGFEHVTAANFLDYFTLNGSATYKDGVVTLTTNDSDLVGNFALKSKIDMNSSFTLVGQINLGNKTSSQNGADGIAFAFHTGNTTDIGNSGANLGIGGLQNADGFKLDTWHNDAATPNGQEDGASILPNDSNGFGWSSDPSQYLYPQFGAFVNTTNKQIMANDGNYYQRWWATVDDSSAQSLDAADLDGQFHDFSISYDGNTHVLTIKYTQTDGTILTWTKTIENTDEARALIVSASTGWAKNLQQFKITSFDFKEAATVNVKYVDINGNTIADGSATYPDGPYVNSSYSTEQKDIDGYTFLKMDDGTATKTVSIAASGTLKTSGNNGTVIYVYISNTDSQSMSESTSSSISESTSSSESSVQSESTSESVSGSESTSTSVSDSESTSSSVSESESESTSTSVSESESASTSVSESESTSESVSGSESTSTSVSGSESTSTSVSESESTSESVSGSESTSTSVSESESTSSSVSESESTSTSVSESESTSTSVSESESASTSVSESESTSTSVSGSESTSESVSESESASTSVSESESTSESVSGSESTSTSV